jgi:hypothetical protein
MGRQPARAKSIQNYGRKRGNLCASAIQFFSESRSIVRKRHV